MQYVTVVNRTTRALQGVWDGRTYTIPPGSSSWPQLQAQRFKAQNPIMGTENPYTGERQYLIGIVEDGDDCTPTEQSSAIELLNRQAMPSRNQVEVIEGAGGLYTPPSPQSPDVFMTHPD